MDAELGRVAVKPLVGAPKAKDLVLEVRPGFEGGQMPLQRRLPKRGFHNPFRKVYAEVNVRDLERFAPDSVVDEELLRQSGLVKGKWNGIKLLGSGDITRSLTVKVDRCSAGARQKIEAAGGQVETV